MDNDGGGSGGGVWHTSTTSRILFIYRATSKHSFFVSLGLAQATKRTPRTEYDKGSDHFRTFYFIFAS
jgi:hypothetical protein